MPVDFAAAAAMQDPRLPRSASSHRRDAIPWSGEIMIKILQMNNDFAPLGKPLPRPAAPAPEPVQIKPGIWKNPDGRLETRNPTVDLIVNGGYGGKPAPKTTPAAIGVDL